MPVPGRRLAAGCCAGAAVLVALAACAYPAGGAPVGGGARPAEELTVTVDPGDGGPAAAHSLTCGSTPGGTHPDAAAACRHLQGTTDPFAPLPTDLVCTEQYGGPQTARVTGRWDGAPVDLALSRTDGCRITQWDALGPLLPGPVGVAPPG